MRVAVKLCKNYAEGPRMRAKANDGVTEVAARHRAGGKRAEGACAYCIMVERAAK